MCITGSNWLQVQPKLVYVVHTSMWRLEDGLRACIDGHGAAPPHTRSPNVTPVLLVVCRGNTSILDLWNCYRT